MEERDERMYKALLLLLSRGDFSVEWREAPALYALDRWIKELPERLKEKEQPKPKATKRGTKPKS